MTLASTIAAAKENTSITQRADTALAESLVLSNRAGIRLMSGCETRPNGGGGSPLMTWNGDEGGRMVVFDRTLFCELSGYTMELDSKDGSGPTAHVGIDLDGFQGQPVPGQPYYGFGTQCTIERVNFLAWHANPNYEMLRIAATVVQNQEYHSVTRCNFNGGARRVATDPRVGRAIRVGPSANAKAERVNGCLFHGFGAAIQLEGGSAQLGTAEINSYTDNEIDILRTGASEPSISRANSEASRQHLVDRMGYGFTILSGTRLHNGWQRPGLDNAYIVAGQSLTVETIQFDSVPPDGGYVFDLRNCQVMTGGVIHFAPNTPLSKTGLLTMPHTPDRYLDVVIYDVVDDVTGRTLPRRFIQGGARWAVYGDGRVQAIDAMVSASGENIDACFVREHLVQATNASGDGRFAGAVTTYEKQGGGPPRSVDAVRLEPA